MVPDRYFSVFHGPSTLKFILLTLIDHYILCTFCFTSFIWLGAKIKKSKSKWSWQIAKLRIITFHNQFTLVKPLFKELKILPLYNMIQMQNCHLVLSHLSNNLPGTFRDFFKYTNNQYGHKSLILHQVLTFQKSMKIDFSKLKIFYIQALNFPHVYWRMLHKVWNQNYTKNLSKKSGFDAKVTFCYFYIPS